MLKSDISCCTFSAILVYYKSYYMLKKIFRSYFAVIRMVIRMDKSRQEKIELRRKKENENLNKLLVWFAGAIIYEAFVLVLKRFYINFSSTSLAEINFALGMSKVFMVLQFVAPILTVVALVRFVRSRKQGKPTRKSLVSMWVCAVLAVTAVVAYQFRGIGVTALGVAAPVAAVLALIYYLYQKEFFCNTVLAGMGIVALWVYRKGYVGHPRMIYFGFALVWICLIAAVVLVWKISKEKGKWNGVQVFSAKTSYVPTYVSAALAAVLMLAVLAVPAYGATIAYYAIFALVTWLFCMAIYYTVRMM